MTAATLAPGAIHQAAAAFGTCPPGQYLRGLLANGTLLCAPVGTAPVFDDIDTAGDVGLHPSIARGADGLGIISHYDATNRDLRVTHCLNAACTSAASTSVDTTGDVGQFSSIAIGADGLGIISHYDASNGDLRETHCANVACTAATSTTVDSVGDVRRDSALAIGADGLAIVAHASQSGLRVSHCNDVACTSATTTSFPVTSAGAPAIAVGGDGFALIAHGRTTELGITHCTNTACTAATSAALDLLHGEPSLHRCRRPSGPQLHRHHPGLAAGAPLRRRRLHDVEHGHRGQPGRGGPRFRPGDRH